jgi:hypothetical protein
MRRRLLVVLLLLAAILVVPSTPAHAEDLGRNCERYYAQGNPDSPWRYTACVKLIYNSSTNRMVATASVSSSTPGIRIRVYALRMFVEDERGNSVAIRTAPTTGFHSDGFASTTTSSFTCNGAYVFAAIEGTDAYWPNGVYSPVQNTRLWFESLHSTDAYIICG